MLSVAEAERELHSVRRLLRSSGCPWANRALLGVLRCAWPDLLKNWTQPVAETKLDVCGCVLALAAMLAGCLVAAARAGIDRSTRWHIHMLGRFLELVRPWLP